MRLGFALFAGAAPEILRASAREAEGLGYSSFWVNHPGATDGLAALALAAGETRRIELGIGVIPLHTRGPDSIVQGVHANGLPLDRLLLGVGSPNPGALTRVREGVAALRSKLAARLVVAALGPQMCRVAGEVADAVLFNWLTPEHARRSDRKSTRLNSSHSQISYAVFCLKKKTQETAASLPRMAPTLRAGCGDRWRSRRRRRRASCPSALTYRRAPLGGATPGLTALSARQ